MMMWFISDTDTVFVGQYGRHGRDITDKRVINTLTGEHANTPFKDDLKCFSTSSPFPIEFIWCPDVC